MTMQVLLRSSRAAQAVASRQRCIFTVSAARTGKRSKNAGRMASQPQATEHQTTEGQAAKHGGSQAHSSLHRAAHPRPVCQADLWRLWVRGSRGAPVSPSQQRPACLGLAGNWSGCGVSVDGKERTGNARPAAVYSKKKAACPTVVGEAAQAPGGARGFCSCDFGCLGRSRKLDVTASGLCGFSPCATIHR